MEITVASTVGFYKGRTLKIGNKDYIITDSTSTTLTVRKKWLWDRFADWLHEISYRIRKWYYENLVPDDDL